MTRARGGILSILVTPAIYLLAIKLIALKQRIVYFIQYHCYAPFPPYSGFLPQGAKERDTKVSEENYTRVILLEYEICRPSG